ncbi:hypothetical protein D3C79_1078300 [compost metagenome]
MGENERKSKCDFIVNLEIVIFLIGCVILYTEKPSFNLIPSSQKLPPGNATSFM